jgi:hypothetical protein
MTPEAQPVPPAEVQSICGEAAELFAKPDTEAAVMKLGELFRRLHAAGQHAEIVRIYQSPMCQEDEWDFHTFIVAYAHAKVGNVDTAEMIYEELAGMSLLTPQS